MKPGDMFTAPTMGYCLIRVTRVAKTGSWADISVHTGVSQWTKRQPLIDGKFAFPVRAVLPSEDGAE